MPHIVNRLASYTDHHIPNLQSSLVGRRTGNDIFQQDTVIHRQMQAFDQVGIDGAQINADLAAMHMPFGANLVVDAAHHIAGNREAQTLVAAGLRTE